MTNMGFSSLKFEIYQYHKSFGIMILLLSVFRLVWRLTHKAPALPDTMLLWQKRVSHLSHKAFYILMIGIPLSGWAMVSASTLNIKTKLFKLIPWPHIPAISPSEALEKSLKNAHEWLAILVFLLLLLHVGAALKHHFKDKDHVLGRMIPWVKPKP